jgi:hypothetical protein
MRVKSVGVKFQPGVDMRAEFRSKTPAWSGYEGRV